MLVESNLRPSHILELNGGVLIINFVKLYANLSLLLNTSLVHRVESEHGLVFGVRDGGLDFLYVSEMFDQDRLDFIWMSVNGERGLDGALHYILVLGFDGFQWSFTGEFALFRASVISIVLISVHILLFFQLSFLFFLGSSRFDLHMSFFKL